MSLGALTQYITIPIKLFPEVLGILTEKLRGIFASNLNYRLVFNDTFVLSRQPEQLLYWLLLYPGVKQKQ